MIPAGLGDAVGELVTAIVESVAAGKHANADALAADIRALAARVRGMPSTTTEIERAVQEHIRKHGGGE